MKKLLIFIVFLINTSLSGQINIKYLGVDSLDINPLQKYYYDFFKKKKLDSTNRFFAQGMGFELSDNYHEKPLLYSQSNGWKRLVYIYDDSKNDYVTYYVEDNVRNVPPIYENYPWYLYENSCCYFFVTNAGLSRVKKSSIENGATYLQYKYNDSIFNLLYYRDTSISGERAFYISDLKQLRYIKKAFANNRVWYLHSTDNMFFYGKWGDYATNEGQLELDSTIVDIIIDKKMKFAYATDTLQNLIIFDLQEDKTIFKEKICSAEHIIGNYFIDFSGSGDFLYLRMEGFDNQKEYIFDLKTYEFISTHTIMKRNEYYPFRYLKNIKFLPNTDIAVYFNYNDSIDVYYIGFYDLVSKEKYKINITDLITDVKDDLLVFVDFAFNKSSTELKILTNKMLLYTFSLDVNIINGNVEDKE